MRGRRADPALIQRIAEQIFDPAYELRAFHADVLAAFPELALYGLRPAHALEYQRTVGALFAVYWLLRLDGDGTYGFSCGVDREKWRPQNEFLEEERVDGDGPLTSGAPSGGGSCVQSNHQSNRESLQSTSSVVSHFGGPRRSRTAGMAKMEADTPRAREADTPSRNRWSMSSAHRALVAWNETVDELPRNMSGTSGNLAGSMTSRAASRVASRAASLIGSRTGSRTASLTGSCQSHHSFQSERRSSSRRRSTVLQEVVRFLDMTADTKRRTFHESMEWDEFALLVELARCDGEDRESVMALLSLTAFHDIMKIDELRPTVQRAHAPYGGYEADEPIVDHDVALSYVLEHYPELIPSFDALPPGARQTILFAHSKMNFNHGWFVQAEGPPCGMLSGLRTVFAGKADPPHIAFYFLHWFTDLAGADGRPLAGAEKLVLKFPISVLMSFLWSVPFLHKLTHANETSVVEEYLLGRWFEEHPCPPPTGTVAIALLRLSVMSQHPLVVVRMFWRLPRSYRALLATELARTGDATQRFARALSPPISGGPAFLVYYGPALLQRNTGAGCAGGAGRAGRLALTVLCEVFVAGRALWPERDEDASKTVTLHIGQLKDQGIDRVLRLARESDMLWVMVRKNAIEAVVELRRAAELNSLTAYWILDLPFEPPEDSSDDESAASGDSEEGGIPSLSFTLEDGSPVHSPRRSQRHSGRSSDDGMSPRSSTAGAGARPLELRRHVPRISRTNFSEEVLVHGSRGTYRRGLTGDVGLV